MFIMSWLRHFLFPYWPVWIFPERISGEDLTSHQKDKIFKSAGQVYRWHIPWPLADVLLSSGQMRGSAHRFDSHVSNVLQIPPQVSAHLPARSKKPLWHPPQSTSITQRYGGSPVLLVAMHVQDKNTYLPHKKLKCRTRQLTYLVSLFKSSFYNLSMIDIAFFYLFIIFYVWMGKVFIEKNMNQQIIRFGMTLALTLCQFWILIWNKAVPPSTACILMEHDKKLFHILFWFIWKDLIDFFFFLPPLTPSSQNMFLLP